MIMNQAFYDMVEIIFKSWCRSFKTSYELLGEFDFPSNLTYKQFDNNIRQQLTVLSA